MTSIPPYQIVPLAPQHERAGFSCNDENLDNYLKKNISSDVKRNACSAHVLTKTGKNEVLGFYTLSPETITFENAPEEIYRMYRKNRIGVVLLGRYAIHSSLQGKGIGKMMLMKIYSDVYKSKNIISSAGIIVDAKTESAKSFWKSREFVKISQDSQESEKFLLPMKYIEKLFNKPAGS